VEQYLYCNDGDGFNFDADTTLAEHVRRMLRCNEAAMTLTASQLCILHAQLAIRHAVLELVIEHRKCKQSALWALAGFADDVRMPIELMSWREAIKARAEDRAEERAVEQKKREEERAVKLKMRAKEWAAKQKWMEKEWTRQLQRLASWRLARILIQIYDDVEYSTRTDPFFRRVKAAVQGFVRRVGLTGPVFEALVLACTALHVFAAAMSLRGKCHPKDLEISTMLCTWALMAEMAAKLIVAGPVEYLRSYGNAADGVAAIAGAAEMWVLPRAAPRVRLLHALRPVRLVRGVLAPRFKAAVRSCCRHHR